MGKVIVNKGVVVREEKSVQAELEERLWVLDLLRTLRSLRLLVRFLYHICQVEYPGGVIKRISLQERNEDALPSNYMGPLLIVLHEKCTTLLQLKSSECDILINDSLFLWTNKKDWENMLGKMVLKNISHKY